MNRQQVLERILEIAIKNEKRIIQYERIVALMAGIIALLGGLLLCAILY